MNSLPSAKYKQTPNEIEKNSLNSEVSKGRFNFLRLKKLEKKKLDKKELTRKFTREKNQSQDLSSKWEKKCYCLLRN